MKTIHLPVHSTFLSFDNDIGRMIAIAEYPDESMLNERMRHDWRIGRQLLDAVKSGALSVRDGETKMPLAEDSPWWCIQSSVVSKEDFQAFASDLGYHVVVGLDSGAASESMAMLADVGTGNTAKLSTAQRAEVVRLFNNGHGPRVAELARRFKVSRPIIDKVLQRAGVKVKPTRRASH